MTKQALTIIALACLAGHADAQTRSEEAELPRELESTEVPLEPLEANPSMETEAAPPPKFPDLGGDIAEPGGRAQAEEAPVPGLRITVHKRMVALINEQRYAEAEEAARAVVQLTERQFGTDSLELAAPLDNLATAQMLNGDLTAAEQSYRRGIALIARHEGQLSPRLINPYIGLGATYNRGGLHEKAEEAFGTALRLNNVNEGFYNLDQMKIRDGLTEAYIGLQEIEEANFQQVVQLEIYQRRLGEDNPEITPAMYKLARWYERSNQPEAAQYTYRRAQQLIRKNYGRESVEMVTAYEGLAGNYERQGDISGSASYLKKALKIIEGQQEADRPKQAELLIRLGELYGRTGRYDTANAYYERGWQALTLEAGYEDLRTALFDKPVRITGLGWNNLRFAPGSVSDWNLLSDGYVLLRYNVNEKGRAENIRIVESDPEGIMDRRISSALKRAYFRPRFTDGVAVTAENVMYRHDFRYQPKDVGRSEDAGEPIEPPENDGRLEYPDNSDG